MHRYIVERLLHYPPDMGGAGGTTDNTAGRSGASESGAVESGTASEAMIAAVEASSASAGDDESLEADEDADSDVPTGDEGNEAEAEEIHASGATGTKGEAPTSRIETAVKNARTKLLSQVNERFGWAEHISPEDGRVAVGLATAMLRDTQGFAEKLAGELGYRLVPVGEEAGARPPGGAGAGAFALPEPELKSQDGRGAFSSTQVMAILGDFEKRLEAKITGIVKPMQTFQKTAEQRELETRLDSEARSSVQTMMTEFRARPYFLTDDGKGGKKEHPSILRNLQAIPPQVRARIGAEASLHRAYSKYLSDEVFPTIGTTAAADVRAENARKIRASSGTVTGTGGRGGDAPKLKDGDISGLAAHMTKLAGSNARV